MKSKIVGAVIVTLALLVSLPWFRPQSQPFSDAQLCRLLADDYAFHWMQRAQREQITPAHDAVMSEITSSAQNRLLLKKHEFKFQLVIPRGTKLEKIRDRQPLVSVQVGKSTQTRMVARDAGRMAITSG